MHGYTYLTTPLCDFLMSNPWLVKMVSGRVVNIMRLEAIMYGMLWWNVFTQELLTHSNLLCHCKEESPKRKDKGITMAEWPNQNQNSSFVNPT